jgi:DHA1 family multidrug resistance protein-like MFS transporter
LNNQRAVWGVVIIVATAQLGFATILPLLPLHLTERLGASVKLVGLVIAAFALVETIFKTAWGGLTDRFGRKPVMVLGLLLSAGAPLVMAVLRTPVLFVPLRLLDGMGSAAIWPAAAAVIADRTPPDRRATGMGMLNVAFLAGVAAGPALGLFVAGFAGDFRAGFYLASALMVVAAILAALLVPGGHDGHGASGPPVGYHPEIRPAYLSVVTESFRASPALFSLYLVAFVQMLGVGLLIPIAAIYAKQVVGLSEHEIGMLFLLIVASVALATIPGGWLADRVGKMSLVKLGMVLGAAGMWLVPLSSRLPGLVLAAVLLGLSYALSFPAFLALVSEMAPPGRLGLAIGASETVQGLGIVLGPLVGGVLWDAVGPQAPFVASAVAITAGAIIAALALRQPRPA